MRVTGFYSVSGHDISMIAETEGYQFEVSPQKEGDKGVSIYFSPFVSLFEKENIPLSFESRDTLIRDLQNQLGWKHTETKLSSYISVICFVSDRLVDQHTYQQLIANDSVFDVVFRIDRWEIHWKEKDTEINSLRAMHRKHPEYFVGRKTPVSAKKSRLRPSHRVPQRGRVAAGNSNLEEKEETKK